MAGPALDRQEVGPTQVGVSSASRHTSTVQEPATGFLHGAWLDHDMFTMRIVL